MSDPPSKNIVPRAPKTVGLPPQAPRNPASIQLRPSAMRQEGVRSQSLSLAKGKQSSSDGAGPLAVRRADLQPSSLHQYNSARERYAKVMKDLLADSNTFSSPILFSETLMSKVNPAENEDSDDSVNAASACWALDMLASSSGNNWKVLRSIRDALFPFIFLNYEHSTNASSISDAEGALESIVTAKKVQQLALDKSTLQQNPFLSHDFYSLRYEAAMIQLRKLATSEEKFRALVAVRTNSSKKVIRVWETKLIRTVFKAWRGHLRHKKIEKFRRRTFLKHGNRELRKAQVETAFIRWRLIVERNRTTFLEDKSNALMYQLDNSKNQFQLQCYRSDKYLRTVEELREELLNVRRERDKLTDDVRQLERTLREKEQTAMERLNRHVNILLQELSKWRTLARSELDQKALLVQNLELISPESDVKEASVVTSDELAEEEDEELLAMALQGDADQQLAGETSLLKVSKTGTLPNDFNPEKALLRWVNHLIQNSLVAEIKVRNFTLDYQSGEVLLILMHHVFPTQVPYSPLQEANIPKRLDLILELAHKVGLGHLPRVSDIFEGTGDVMMSVTAELFLKSISRAQHDSTQVTDVTLIPSITYDIDMMPHVLDESSKDMTRLLESEDRVNKQKKILMAIEDAIAKHEAYLVRQRLLGHPVQVLDSREVLRYCKFNPIRYRDISFKYNKAPTAMANKSKPDTKSGVTSDPVENAWLSFDDQLGELKTSVRKYFHDIRRIFRYYASGNATMSATAFWRFCGDIRIISKSFGRHIIDRIFIVANADDVPMGAGDEDDDDISVDEENPATELIPSEFVECLVRIADAKIIQGNKMLHERFEYFLTNFVVAFACKSEMEKFKKDIYDNSTQAAVQRFAKDLQKIFGHYADRLHGKRGKAVSFEAFKKLMSDSKLSLEKDALNSIFQNICDEGTDMELSIIQFYEAIVCVGPFIKANPFLSLDKKVDIVCSQMISELRTKLKNLVLSDVKPITV